MINSLIIILGKLVSKASQLLNLGSGSTWPGHIALMINKNFIKDILSKNKIKIMLIAGTNGKTTTSRLIKTILEKNNQKVLQNNSGANLLNGIASTLLLHSTIVCTLNYDYAIFEVDENTLPLFLNELEPDYLILLNLFRDQLDRYGEINIIAQKWSDAIQKLNKKTTLILSADDPQIAHLGLSRSYSNIYYFGLNNKTLSQTKHQHASDSSYCPNCGNKLNYETIYFSHLGIWECPKCKLKRPEVKSSETQTPSLLGIYNQYNINASVLFAKINNINNEIIKQSLLSFTPAFGRQEIIEINNKKVQIFLSKNPTSFNQSLQTINDLGAKNLLIVLNDRIPDGRDVSWIWDIDFEEYLHDKMIIISGDRAYDMALRLKYSSKSQNQNLKFKIYENLKEAINKTLELLPKNQTLYILPTYSAMLEVRKILTGRRIL